MSVLLIQFFGVYWPFYTAMVTYLIYLYFEEDLYKWVNRNFILQNKTTADDDLPSRVQHDQRRQATYPVLYPNTWYHFADTDELTPGKVMEVRALNQTFVLWRKADGTPVCQDAYCLHLGANLAVGGKVKDDCIECPFHLWKFDSEGCIKEIPYIENPHKCPTHTKLKTYPCVDYCGWVLVFFHADGKAPEFEPPKYVPQQLKDEDYMPHLKWNIGFVQLNCIDWCDQVGDHTHFNTLHKDMYIPWTLMLLPDWVLNLFPIGITHKVTTYLGDDKDWANTVERTGWGEVCKQLMYFNDEAGITWGGKVLETTMAETTEMYIGPALIVFHIPFTIGIIKVFVSTTPVEGGSIMRVRTWVDGRVKRSYFIQWIAWFLSGISASQLMADVIIMCNKIRLKKPILQPFDGPYNRVSAWIKQFYSEGSSKIGPEVPYKNDW